MSKPMSPLPPADAAWLHHFQAVSVKVDELRKQYRPENPQTFTNGVWAKHLRKMISGGVKCK